ncbi:hypothetical protein EQG49_02305 [Periweissella cryptocerci]|uniref:DUF3168 domain-containing protein n=1 Tax=Periweissella cryptocerci TaxID=2506420 RepID=A0A4P6YRT6_9LACO|nr:hypothetical protein [Periweissella cryptocerci]QBO35379.1 hypothetical protein EQG49_02305 [Periweissella cryptocerci]
MIKRINVKKAVATTLSGIEGLTLQSTVYPQTWTDEYPSAIFYTSHEPAKGYEVNEELLTHWTITIELYGERSLTDLEDKLDEAFSVLGFRNLSSEDANTAILKRIVVAYEGIVNNETGLVFQS